jgi:uncharacterized protein (TIGR02271 family)
MCVDQPVLGSDQIHPKGTTEALMTDTSQTTWNDWVGADVIDEGGDKIGKLENVYMDQATGQPEWLAVKTGMFGSRETFLPIGGAGADGDALRVPYQKGFVKDAPNVDPEEGFLSGEEEGELYRYYGQDDPYGQGERDTGTDTSGPSTDDAMTRSEEELSVGTQARQAGTARLRKYVVTENVTTTVPVRKERVRVEREPITDANRDAAMAGGDLTEEEHEMVLSEEDVVVDKQAVPKERVRLDKEVETEQRQVSEDVRKERVEVDGDDDR